MGKVAKIDIEQLLVLAGGKDFFKILEGLRQHCSVTQNEISDILGLSRGSVYKLGISNRSYTTFSQPRVQLLIDFFKEKNPAYAGNVIASLNTLRAEPLKEAQSSGNTMQLVKEILSYTGMSGVSFKGISTLFCYNNTTPNKNNVEPAQAKVSEKFSLNDHPELHKCFDILMSKIKQVRPPEAVAAASKKKVSIPMCIFSGDLFPTKKSSVTLSNVR